MSVPPEVPALCSGLSNIAPYVSPLPYFPLEALFFPLISFFPPLFPFCQHFLLANESKKEFLGGAGIIWTFLGSDRGWRCWQLCQSPADGFVMWALECPIWEGAGAKLAHSHIFPGMCSCTYVQGQEKPVKEITPAHPSSILPPGLLWILLLLPALAMDTEQPCQERRRGKGKRGSPTSEFWVQWVTGGAGNAILEYSLCWFLH